MAAMVPQNGPPIVPGEKREPFAWRCHHCYEGMPLHRAPKFCENAVCSHARCDICYFLDHWYRTISHVDGTEVKDEEWLWWWGRFFRGSGRDYGQ